MSCHTKKGGLGFLKYGMLEIKKYFSQQRKIVYDHRAFLWLTFMDLKFAYATVKDKLFTQNINSVSNPIKRTIYLYVAYINAYEG